MKKVAFALLLISLVFLSSTGKVAAVVVDNFWETKASMHVPREGAEAATVDGSIYVFGGKEKFSETNGGFTYISINATEAYNPSIDTWVLKAPMPTARDSFGVAAYKNKVYCFGGTIVTDSLKSNVTNANEVYDTETDTWQTKTAIPTARYGLQASEVDGKFYLIGGWVQSESSAFASTSDKVEVYDPLTDKWTVSSPMPTAVAAYASAVLNGKIYVISGVASGSIRTNLTQIYDPKTDKWSFGVPIPMSISSAAAGATTGVRATKAIYVIGGSNDTYPLNGQYVNQVYFAETDSWAPAARLPIDRAGLAVAVVDDSLYVMGGGHNIFTMDSTTVMRYTPFTNAPSRIEVFPVVLVVAVIVIVAVAGVVVLLYLKKRRLSDRQGERLIDIRHARV